MTPEELEKLMKIISELRAKYSFEIEKIEIHRQASKQLHQQEMEEIALLKARSRKLIEQLAEAKLKADEALNELREFQKQTNSKSPNIDDRLKALINATKIQNSNHNDKHQS